MTVFEVLIIYHVLVFVRQKVLDLTYYVTDVACAVDWEELGLRKRAFLQCNSRARPPIVTKHLPGVQAVSRIQLYRRGRSQTVILYILRTMEIKKNVRHIYSLNHTPLRISFRFAPYI